MKIQLVKLEDFNSHNFLKSSESPLIPIQGTGDPKCPGTSTRHGALEIFKRLTWKQWKSCYMTRPKQKISKIISFLRKDFISIFNHGFIKTPMHTGIVGSHRVP